MHLIFNDIFEHNQFIEGVSEPYTIDHFSGGSLDTFSTFIYAEGVNLRLINAKLHICKHQSQLVLIVYL